MSAAPQAETDRLAAFFRAPVSENFFCGVVIGPELLPLRLVPELLPLALPLRLVPELLPLALPLRLVPELLLARLSQ